MKTYSVDFDPSVDPTMLLRDAQAILGKKGYPAGFRSGADGGTWFYESNNPIDKATISELGEIGVKISGLAEPAEPSR